MRLLSTGNWFAGVFALGGVVATATGAVYAQGSSASLKIPAGTTACSSVSACVFGENSSSGYGVEGTSKSGDGVVGITTYASKSASTGKAGVSGYDNSTNNNKNNSGVYGTSPYGYGVQGKSAHGTGVYGVGGNWGVYATGNVGVYAYSDAGNGEALALESDKSADLLDANQDFDGIGAEQGDGITVTTAYGDGLTATSARGIPLVLDITDEGDTLIDAQSVDVGGSGDAMVLDAYGNLTLAGGLTQNAAARFAIRRADGNKVLTYGAREAEPTLEDSGEVYLVNGIARVALDPAFAATVDLRRSYLVFVTPEGENDGLYVTQKTAAGFTIRESHGERSSLAVEYRIIAKPLGDTNARLAPIASVFPTTPQFLKEKHDLLARQAARQAAHARARAARLQLLGR